MKFISEVVIPATTKTVETPVEQMTLEQAFAVLDARLAVGDSVSRDIANVLGVLKPAAFGKGTATPPVTVIRAKLFPKTRASAAAEATLAWDFSDGSSLVPKTDADTVDRKHLKAAARALGMDYNGQGVPSYDVQITNA